MNGGLAKRKSQLSTRKRMQVGTGLIFGYRSKRIDNE